MINENINDKIWHYDKILLKEWNARTSSIFPCFVVETKESKKNQNKSRGLEN